MITTQLGKYCILEEIGRGGFATVYRAEDSALGREVALKVLDPLLMRDEAFVARFQREARAAASLEHPHIVPIYDVGASDERLFIAMRLVRGGSLAGVLATRGRLPWEEALPILQQVSDALSYAHAEGVVHRDLKPDNILLDERSGAMLSDFGFARLLGTTSLTQSISGGIVGTPAYMAPEIWEDTEATPATDVYALGCVVYEMLTGKALFSGSTPMAVMRAHDQGAHLPAEWPVDIPQALGEVLSKAIARRPAERYASARDFLAALEGLQTAALAEQRAAEAARLLAEARQALEARRYQAALAAAEAAQALQPEHAEGLKILRQAQAHYTRQTELAAQLAERVTQREQQQQDLEKQHTALEERAAALAQAVQARIEEDERLRAEKTRIEARLQELDRQSKEHVRQDAAIQQERRQQQDTLAELEAQQQRLDIAASLLEQGDLDGAAKRLPGNSTPPASSARTAAVAPVPLEAKTPIILENKTDNIPKPAAPGTSAQSSKGSGWWVLVMLIGFISFLLFTSGNEGPGVLFAVFAVFLLLAALITSTKSS